MGYSISLREIFYGRKHFGRGFRKEIYTRYHSVIYSSQRGNMPTIVLVGGQLQILLSDLWSSLVLVMC